MTEMKLYDLEIYKDCRIVANAEDHGFAIADLEPVDAVPVVRCKDCKYFYSECCLKTGFCVDDDWFCADGERKEDDDAAD